MYWSVISSAEIGREWQLLPATALDATATPDGCWALIAAGTAPDTPPKRSTMRTATMAVTIGTRSGALLWWYISHPFSSVNDLDTDVKVLIQPGWKSETLNIST